MTPDDRLRALVEQFAERLEGAGICWNDKAGTELDGEPLELWDEDGEPRHRHPWIQGQCWMRKSAGRIVRSELAALLASPVEAREADADLPSAADVLGILASPVEAEPPPLFPIMGEPKTFIPWAVIAPHEAWARRNHWQSLKVLAARGGLDPAEAVSVIEERPWRRMDDAGARRRLAALVAAPPAGADFPTCPDCGVVLPCYAHPQHGTPPPLAVLASPVEAEPSGLFSWLFSTLFTAGATMEKEMEDFTSRFAQSRWVDEPVNADLLAALKAVVESAHPHQDEHPAMFRAWSIARAAIAKAEAQAGAADPPPSPGWQPMATAPKQHDGLLLTDGARVSQGGWLSQVDQGADYEGQSAAPSPGWWSVDSLEPTHWQPLPAPPDPSQEPTP